MDVLSQALQTVRVELATFRRAELCGAIDVESPRDDGRGVAIGEIAIVLMVLEGECRVEATEHGPIRVEAGSVAVLGSGFPYRVVGRGPAVLIGGALALARDLTHPLFALLPPVVVTPPHADGAEPWFEQAIRARTAQHEDELGFDVVLAKAGEALLVEALRGYVERQSGEETGSLAALRDPVVTRCLSLVHRDPAHPWSVAELARRTHVSRSVLAERFNALVGMPPMQYLKRWRLITAARLLRDDHESLTEVATHVGYESEAAFNRAFKREYGVSPGAYRRARIPRFESGRALARAIAATSSGLAARPRGARVAAGVALR